MGQQDQRTADGLMQQMTYGDAAGTTTAYSYDQRRRLSSVQTYRGPPASGIWDDNYARVSPPDTNEPTSFQLLLQDEDFLYDIVGNPTEIRDWREPEEWPAGAKPVTKKIQYDDLYRATKVNYQYADGDDEWHSPFEVENEGIIERDPRRANPAPHQSFDKRVLEQTFRYDWLGNNEHTDDDAHGFYDRSLGAIQNDATKPYQLAAATQAVSGGSHNGDLTATYDDAGNLTELTVNRGGACLPAGADCDQVFKYEWDEVGRLVRAQRFDGTDPNAAVDLRNYYDASDQRVIKRATVGTDDRYALYVFDTLELRGAQFGAGFNDAGTSGSDYEYTEETAVPYLLANGVRLARVMWEIAEIPALDAGQVHVFFELGDHLGSTSVVLDQATGELVERSTFQAYGGAESDYRPSRWAGFREDYRFTGKEEDVEVGLQYFGKRFLNPLLGRWVSADPLAVHVPISGRETGGDDHVEENQAAQAPDWNLYAYVAGRALVDTDEVGLQPRARPPEPLPEFRPPPPPRPVLWIRLPAEAEARLNQLRGEAFVRYARQHLPILRSVTIQGENAPSGGYIVGPHGRMPSRTTYPQSPAPGDARPHGVESHHVVMDKIGRIMFGEYWSTSRAPAILLTNRQHDITRQNWASINRFMTQHYGEGWLQNVRNNPQLARAISDKLMTGTGVPREVMREYYRQFSVYENRIRSERQLDQYRLEYNYWNRPTIEPAKPPSQ